MRLSAHGGFTAPSFEELLQSLSEVHAKEVQDLEIAKAEVASLKSQLRAIHTSNGSRVHHDHSADRAGFKSEESTHDQKLHRDQTPAACKGFDDPVPCLPNSSKSPFGPGSSYRHHLHPHRDSVDKEVWHASGNATPEENGRDIEDIKITEGNAESSSRKPSKDLAKDAEPSQPCILKTSFSLGESEIGERATEQSYDGLDGRCHDIDGDDTTAVTHAATLRQSVYQLEKVQTLGIRFAESQNSMASEPTDWDDDQEIIRLPFKLRDQWEVPDDMLENLTALRQRYRLQNKNKSSQKLKPMKLINVASNFSQMEKYTVRNWKTKGMIHPQSRKRLFWDISVMIAVLYDLFCIPLQAFNLPDDGGFFVIRWFILVFWTMDMIVGTSTGTFNKDQLIMERTEVLKAYLRTWFIFDAIVVVPEWILLVSGTKIDELGNLKAFRFSRFLRFLRLARLWKVQKAMIDLKYRINSQKVLQHFNLLRMVAFIIFGNHLLACIWYAVGQDGWVVKFIDEPEPHLSMFNRYLISFHWSISQFHGSDTYVLPTNIQEFAVGIMTILFAVFAMSSFLSYITNTMIELHRLAEASNRDQSEVRSFLKDHHISVALSVRVMKYIEWKHRVSQQSLQDVKALVSLPQSMMLDLHEEMRAPVLLGHRFFTDLHAEFPRVLRRLCHEATQCKMFCRGEVLFSAGDACSSMFFISQGRGSYEHGLNNNVPEGLKPDALNSSSSNGNKGNSGQRGDRGTVACNKSDGTTESEDAEHKENIQGDVKPGDFLSEAVLWTEWEHRGEFSVVSDADLMTLDAKEFVLIVLLHPAAHGQTVIYAREFIEFLDVAHTPSDIMRHWVGSKLCAHQSMRKHSTAGRMKKRDTNIAKKKSDESK